MSGVDEHMIIFPVQWNVKDIKGLLRRETERMKKGSTLFLQKKKKKILLEGFQLHCSNESRVEHIGGFSERDGWDKVPANLKSNWKRGTIEGQEDKTQR